MKRMFCWLPTKVYSASFCRDGFRWGTFVWRGADGLHYGSHAPARTTGAAAMSAAHATPMTWGDYLALSACYAAIGSVLLAYIIGAVWPMAVALVIVVGMIVWNVARERIA